MLRCGMLTSIPRRTSHIGLKLVGQIFGYLTVDALFGPINGRRHWTVRCVCG